MAGALVELADDADDDQRQKTEGHGADPPGQGDLVGPRFAGVTAETELCPHEWCEERPDGERGQGDGEYLHDVLEFTVHCFPSRDGWCDSEVVWRVQ